MKQSRYNRECYSTAHLHITHRVGVSSSRMDEFDEYIAPPTLIPNSPKPPVTRNLKSALEKYSKSAFVPAKETVDIILYWRRKANEEDGTDIFLKLAEVIYSVPATQVTVERLFSHLKFIFSDLSLWQHQ